MRKSLSIMLLATTAVALAGCGQAGSAGADAASVEQAIKADEAKWMNDLKAKNTEGLASHYAKDAFFVVAGEEPASGSTEIRRIFANASTDPAFDVQMTSRKVDVSASGDLAYSRGTFTEKYTDPKTSKVMSRAGSYLTVYKKQDDGSWKIVEDVAATGKDGPKAVEPGKPATRAKMVSSGF
jgi:uncharacterized protein (TIGR02246 family)